MRMALFGPPGSGKGTQAAILQERYSLTQLSTGNMLRAARDAGTSVGLDANHYLEAGRLVPDAVVLVIAHEAMLECGFDSFVLDGFPRTIPQADWLDEEMERAGAPFKMVSLEVPHEIIISRLSRRRMHRVTGEVYHLKYKPPPANVPPEDLIQRNDDQPVAIEERLRVYDLETAPIKEHYAARDALVEVDGVGDIETVARRIAESLSL